MLTHYKASHFSDGLLTFFYPCYCQATFTVDKKQPQTLCNPHNKYSYLTCRMKAVADIGKLDNSDSATSNETCN